MSSLCAVCFTPNFKIHFLISETISIFLLLHMYFLGSGKEPTCQCKICRRCGFDRWVGKIPWRRALAAHSSILAWRSPWPEEPDGFAVHRITESDMTEETQHACIVYSVCILFPSFYFKYRQYGSAFLRLMRLSLGGHFN